MTCQPMISESWARCRQAGMDPEKSPRAVRVSSKEFDLHFQHASDIARLARPLMDDMLSFVSSGFWVFLTDSHGCILASRASQPCLDSGEIDITPGTLWSEEHQGTSAVGLAIREGVPCTVSGAEHYFAAYRRLAGAATPIVSPEGEFLGVIGILGVGDACHPHTLGMIVAASAAIENQMKLERAANQLYSVIQSISDGLIAVDNDGFITHMNSVAGRIFGLKTSSCVGMPVEEVFKGSFPLLQMFKTGREGFNDRELAITFNGRRVHITVSSRPVCSEQRKVFGVVLTCREMKSVQRLVTRMAGAQARFTLSDLVGEDPKFLAAIGMARRVARSDSTVLIIGESGTGKELFAQSIHNASPQREGPFVAVNAAALPRDLVESELFGYEEGAFTGARRGGRPGKFELASGGTLLLDEIGDIPLEVQISLLRVLQEKQVVRIGGHAPIPLQMRVIAATNKDLARLVEEGRFRLDLYYRISVVNLTVPPLRERNRDVLLLADCFLKRFAKLRGQGEISLSEKAREALMRYSWPGNVRELQNVIEQAVHMLEGNEVGPEHLPERIRDSQPDPAAVAIALDTPGLSTLNQAERALMLKTLRSCGGNISNAARCLGIGRTTLYRKLALHGIDLGSVRKTAT